MRFCWQQHVVYCVPKTPIPSPRFVLSTTLSPSLRSCSRLLFPRGTPVTCKEKSLPCRRIAAKTPHRQIPDPTPAPVQNPALPRDRQHWRRSRCSCHRICDFRWCTDGPLFELRQGVYLRSRALHALWSGSARASADPQGRPWGRVGPGYSPPASICRLRRSHYCHHHCCSGLSSTPTPVHRPNAFASFSHRGRLYVSSCSVPPAPGLDWREKHR